MEPNQLDEQLHESQLRIWERLMYVGLGSAVAIIFHRVDQLRDAIIMFTLLYTTLAGFYLLWTISSQGLEISGLRRKVAFGHLIASWLTVFGIYSYSQLAPLGLVVLVYTVLLVAVYWRTGKVRSPSDQMFP
jgi:hypothetical protein